MNDDYELILFSKVRNMLSMLIKMSMTVGLLMFLDDGGLSKQLIAHHP